MDQRSDESRGTKESRPEETSSFRESQGSIIIIITLLFLTRELLVLKDHDSYIH